MPRSLALCSLALAFMIVLPPVAAADPEQDSDATFSPNLTFRFTAPGDNGRSGRADHYEIRYSVLPIDETTYFFARVVPLPDEPAMAGTPQSVEMALPVIPNFGYYFAMRSVDAAGNWSPVSNVAYIGPEALIQPEKSMAQLATDGVTLSFSSPRPNPARESARFDFTLPQATAMQVDVFDAAGRRVRTLASGTRSAGQDQLVWDLRTESGMRAGPGLYLVRAKLGDQIWTRRVTVVH